MNLPTFLVLAAVAALLVLITVSHIKGKKNGKSSCSCGGGCQGCAMNGSCHGQ